MTLTGDVSATFVVYIKSGPPHKIDNDHCISSVSDIVMFHCFFPNCEQGGSGTKEVAHDKMFLGIAFHTWCIRLLVLSRYSKPKFHKQHRSQICFSGTSTSDSKTSGTKFIYVAIGLLVKKLCNFLTFRNRPFSQRAQKPFSWHISKSVHSTHSKLHEHSDIITVSNAIFF